MQVHHTTLDTTIIPASLASLASAERINVLILGDPIYLPARPLQEDGVGASLRPCPKRVFLRIPYAHALLVGRNTLLSVSHTLLSTQNLKNRLCPFSEKENTCTSGGKRRKLAQRKATKVMLCLLQDAKETAIPSSYVLFDTWFCSPTSLLSVHELGYEVVAMAKKTERIYYLHEGVMQDVKAIYRKHRKRRGRSKYLLSVEVADRKGTESLSVRLVFIRNRNTRKAWLVLVTTDMSLTE